MVILHSSDPKGTCYVETKNLDGETNLKMKTAHKDIRAIISPEGSDDTATLKNLATAEGHVGCDKPNNAIYKFDGAFNLNKKDISLSADNVALRGSSIRNTDFVYGMIVYTGHDTKIMMNSAQAKFKFSELEKNTNICILSILCLQAILSLIAAFMGTGYAINNYTSLNWVSETNKTSPDTSGTLIAQLFGTWILLLTNFVPISLIVQMELVNFWQAMFMTYDVLMYDARKEEDPADEDMPMRAQASNLNA